MHGGVHGDDEVSVYRELCQVVDDWLADMQAEGEPLLTPTVSKDAARALAQRLYPTAPLGRKKDGGLADAILMAQYGAENLLKPNVFAART